MSEFDGTELDFWLGSWEVSWGEHGRGTNRIERILGDHVIHEQFDGSDETSRIVGESWSVFDPDRRIWRQTWVDDQGGYLDLVGVLVDGWVSFGRDAPEDGANARQRMVFRDVTAAGFHWVWEASADDGVTWQSRWEIDYRRA